MFLVPSCEEKTDLKSSTSIWEVNTRSHLVLNNVGVTKVLRKVVPVFVITVNPYEDKGHEEQDDEGSCNEDCHVPLIPRLNCEGLLLACQSASGWFTWDNVLSAVYALLDALWVRFYCSYVQLPVIFATRETPFSDVRRCYISLNWCFGTEHQLYDGHTQRAKTYCFDNWVYYRKVLIIAISRIIIYLKQNVILSKYNSRGMSASNSNIKLLSSSLWASELYITSKCGPSFIWTPRQMSWN